MAGKIATGVMAVRAFDFRFGSIWHLRKSGFIDRDKDVHFEQF